MSPESEIQLFVLNLVIESNDIEKRSKEIQDLLMGDNVFQAIKRLMDYVRDFSEDKDDYHEVIVISQGYHRLEKMERRNLFSYDEAKKNRDQILYQMLQLIESIQTNLAFKLMT